jgi:hypothetical protein
VYETYTSGPSRRRREATNSRRTALARVPRAQSEASFSKFASLTKKSEAKDPRLLLLLLLLVV